MVQMVPEFLCLRVGRRLLADLLVQPDHLVLKHLWRLLHQPNQVHLQVHWCQEFQDFLKVQQVQMDLYLQLVLSVQSDLWFQPVQLIQLARPDPEYLYRPGLPVFLQFLRVQHHPLDPLVLAVLAGQLVPVVRRLPMIQADHLVLGPLVPLGFQHYRFFLVVQLVRVILCLPVNRSSLDFPLDQQAPRDLMTQWLPVNLFVLLVLVTQPDQQSLVAQHFRLVLVLLHPLVVLEYPEDLCLPGDQEDLEIHLAQLLLADRDLQPDLKVLVNLLILAALTVPYHRLDPMDQLVQSAQGLQCCPLDQEDHFGLIVLKDLSHP